MQQVDWGKGRALSHMLNALGLDDCDDVIPIYLGDDRTDEDAFKVLKERASGFGILISNKVSCSSCQQSGSACLLKTVSCLLDEQRLPDVRAGAFCNFDRQIASVTYAKCSAMSL